MGSGELSFVIRHDATLVPRYRYALSVAMPQALRHLLLIILRVPASPPPRVPLIRFLAPWKPLPSGMGVRGRRF
jgi:hypothetical protein